MRIKTFGECKVGDMIACWSDDSVWTDRYHPIEPTVQVLAKVEHGECISTLTLADGRIITTHPRSVFEVFQTFVAAPAESSLRTSLGRVLTAGGCLYKKYIERRPCVGI